MANFSVVDGVAHFESEAAEDLFVQQLRIGFVLGWAARFLEEHDLKTVLTTALLGKMVVQRELTRRMRTAFLQEAVAREHLMFQGYATNSDSN